MSTETPIVRQKMSFPLQNPVYLAASSNVIVPSGTCCTTLFNIVPSNLPDGSFFISTDNQRYLDTVFIDLKGPASFYSVQLVPYQGVKRGWMMETSNNNNYRFSQQLDTGKVFLGLSLDQRTVQGFDRDRGIYATLDLLLSA